MRERIKRVMAKVFGVTEGEVPDDATINEFSEWDSLRHLELMLALETEFKVRIPTDAMLELLSLEAIDTHLQERAAGVAGARKA